MEDHNGLNSSCWYVPAEPEKKPEPAPVPERKKNKTARIIALVLVAAILLGAAGYGIFGLKRPAVQFESWSYDSSQDKPDNAFSDMPENFHDFFAQYYAPSDESANTEVYIEKYAGEVSFKPDVKKASGEEMNLSELYENCYESVVSITAYADGSSGYYWGTGFVLSEDGLILTNTHIIEECSSATVTLHDDRTFDAKLIGADSISDIALLKIEAEGLVPAQLGTTEDIKVGQKVAALGNPLGETFRMTLTDGIISGLSRAMNYKGHTMTLLQTNAALNEGNSGGPLFNMYGQVIGVTNMKMMTSSTDNAIEGIGFAIPTDTMVEIVQSLIENGEVTGRATIGITVGGIPEEANSEYKLPEGLYVVSVVENSDAAKQGVKAGDIVTAVNGQAVTETQQVLDIKEDMKVGDKLTLTIWREGETFDVEITLMEANDLY